MSVRILVGDMRERLRDLPDASVDSCVTDPPYHLTSIVKRFSAADAAPAKVGATGAYARASRGFMGQTWDGGDVAFQPETWAEVLRVLKPGAHVVAFSHARTYHRMVCAIEDAGFEVRDQLAWIYGSGFPKSHNLDGEWEGWGSALKPAWEPICLARKPLVGTIAGNVLAHGTGALNIDGCRTPAPGEEITNHDHGRESGVGVVYGAYAGIEPHQKPGQALGRWPANLIHDGCDEVVAAFPVTSAGGFPAARGKGGISTSGCSGQVGLVARATDAGSAARFFYSAKAAKEDRGDGNTHPTVKPVDLMRWLCRLVTPPGGTALDPFAGSGSTLVAADMEQFDAIGVELSPDYAAIAERRVRDRAGLFAEVEAA